MRFSLVAALALATSTSLAVPVGKSIEYTKR